MEEKLNEILELINKSDYILIGCGEELSFDKVLKENDNCYEPFYPYKIHNKEELMSFINNQEHVTFIDSLLHKIRHYNYKEKNNIYDKLYDVVKNKNYFIVTTNTDNLIYQSNFLNEFIVAPCGDERLLQCSVPCEQTVFQSSDYLEYISKNLNDIISIILKREFELLKNYYPICPNCGEVAGFNIRSEVKQYVEQGYLDQWSIYMNWLMKTLNKNVVLLELGESFLNPTVIRWPFEKTTYLNNKAKLIRINENFPQVSEEIKDKSITLSINSADFINKLYSYQISC